MVDQKVIETEILTLLPPDGAAVLNRVMMALIGRRLGQRIGSESYFDAVDGLGAVEAIGRLRGQGGKIYRVAVVPPIDPSALVIAWPEPKLMPSLGKFLKTIFWRGLDLPLNHTFKVVDTSMHGPQEKWGRPDFTVVTVTPMRVLPEPQLDVHAFELKAEPAADITSVHQALAQTRMTHYGSLVWHLPEGSSHEVRLAGILEQCRLHGIGLILIRDPEVVETWSIEVEPVRHATAPTDIDTFLAARLSDADCLEIKCALAGA
jgi:hypothetical protein